jgi:hypothetical protein
MWDLSSIRINHERMDKLEIKNLLDNVKTALDMSDYEEAKELLAKAGRKIKNLKK